MESLLGSSLYMYVDELGLYLTFNRGLSTLFQQGNGLIEAKTQECNSTRM